MNEPTVVKQDPNMGLPVIPALKVKITSSSKKGGKLGNID